MDRRRPEDKPKGASKPSRVNRLLLAQASQTYGGDANLIMIKNLKLSSQDFTDIRQDLRQKGIRVQMVRNRIAARAFWAMGVKEAERLFLGPTSIIQADDPVMAAKTALEICKKFDKKMVLAGGLIEVKVLSSKDVEILSRSKTKPEILAEIAGMAKGPGGRLVAQCLGPGARIAGALKELIKKREESAGATA